MDLGPKTHSTHPGDSRSRVAGSSGISASPRCYVKLTARSAIVRPDRDRRIDSRSAGDTGDNVLPCHSPPP